MKSLPYELNIREPSFEIRIRTKSEVELAELERVARNVLSTGESHDEMLLFRYSIPDFLRQDREFLKALHRYEQKYPTTLTIDFNLRLTRNLELKVDGSALEYTLGKDQIERARTKIKASLPDETEEVFVVSRGNVSRSTLEPIAEALRKAVDTVKIEHRDTDLDEVVRIVLFCFGGPGIEFQMLT